LTTRDDRSWISVQRVSRGAAMWTPVLREVKRRRKSIYSPMERVEMLAGVMGGKPSAGRPILPALSWKSETRWSRLPVAGRGERGARVMFFGVPPSWWWWEAMSEGWSGDTKSKQ